MEQVKTFLLIWAEIVDSWRVAPRLVLIFYAHMVLTTTHWFMALPVPSAEQSGVVMAIWGSAALIFNFYAKSGRAWGPQVEWQDIANPHLSNQQSQYYGRGGSSYGSQQYGRQSNMNRQPTQRQGRQPRTAPVTKNNQEEEDA
jgi:hypothetical protein